MSGRHRNLSRFIVASMLVAIGLMAPGIARAEDVGGVVAGLGPQVDRHGARAYSSAARPRPRPGDRRSRDVEQRRDRLPDLVERHRPDSAAHARDPSR